MNGEISRRARSRKLTELSLLATWPVASGLRKKNCAPVSSQRSCCVCVCGKQELQWNVPRAVMQKSSSKYARIT